MTQDDIVVGLLFGDEGKGTTVDFLAHQKKPVSVVKFSGGSQTAHNVIHPNGTHHTFSQFGSASLQQIPTTITKTTLVEPYALTAEGDLIYKKTKWNPFPDLIISENSPLIAPFHQWLNKKREEARGGAAHGSCAQGIGETRYFQITNPEWYPTMGDLKNLPLLTKKLQHLKTHVEQQAQQKTDININKLVEEYNRMVEEQYLHIVPDEQILNRIHNGYHIFEGTQGVLLDEAYGFFPHTTWTSVTPANAQQLLLEAGKTPGKVTGVTRTYLTRHGYGPFPSELPETREIINRYPEQHNKYEPYTGGWRRGLFDLYLYEYALRAAGGVDALSLTHVDLFQKNHTIVSGYDTLPEIPTLFYGKLTGDDISSPRTQQENLTRKIQDTTLDQATLTQYNQVKDFITILSELANAPVEITSHGPTYENKNWGG